MLERGVGSETCEEGGFGRLRLCSRMPVHAFCSLMYCSLACADLGVVLCHTQERFKVLRFLHQIGDVV
jgi:hypothetical protein